MATANCEASGTYIISYIIFKFEIIQLINIITGSCFDKLIEMVLIIKQSDNIDHMVDRICKTMINIEQNKTIFKKDGSIIHDVDIVEPFNTYTYKQVNYDITASLGVLLIYKTNITFSELYLLLIAKFEELDAHINYSNLMISCSRGCYKSTYHTLITTSYKNMTKNLGRHHNRCLVNYDSVNVERADNLSQFMWHIQIINTTSYLHISELSYNYSPNKSYLMRGTSTIIYDDYNLFNVSDYTKQINYPALEQYIAFDQNRLLNETVYISRIVGLDYEIMRHYYTDDIDEYNKYSIISEGMEFEDYKKFKIRRVNISKKWYTQITELFDYATQEELEQTRDETGKPPFPNDVCFITRAPIYGAFYIFEVRKLARPSRVSARSQAGPAESHEAPAQQAEAQANENVSYIMVSPMIYMCCMKIKNKIYSFMEYFEKKSGYTISRKYIGQYARTEYECIQMIPDKKISSEKRDILLSISRDNAKIARNINGEVCYGYAVYVANISKKLIYVGLQNVADVDVIKYANNNTIIFGVVLYDYDA